ncbi:hypothetical protein BaRGS_00008258, partial [Batillaria attramentaria]
VMKESSNHTKYASLSFPGASQVDVYPAERLGDFYDYYGASGSNDSSIIAMPDDDLYLAQVTFLEQGVDLATYKAQMKALGKEFIKSNNAMNFRIFHVTAMMPLK